MLTGYKWVGAELSNYENGLTRSSHPPQADHMKGVWEWSGFPVTEAAALAKAVHEVIMMDSIDG